MKISNIYIVLLILLEFSCNGGKDNMVAQVETIKWMDINQIDNISNKEGKMYFIDLYTDWCGWCKTMDKKTFSHNDVVTKMNKSFHSIKFNAEQKDAVTFNGKKYDWQSLGRNGVNSLAVELTNGNLSYPSFIILDKEKKPKEIIYGFKEASEFNKILDAIK